MELILTIALLATELLGWHSEYEQSWSPKDEDLHWLLVAERNPSHFFQEITFVVRAVGRYWGQLQHLITQKSAANYGCI